MKSILSDSKLKTIEENYFKIRDIEEDIKTIAVKTESIVTINDLENVTKLFDSCVKVNEYSEFEK